MHRRELQHTGVPFSGYCSVKRTLRHISPGKKPFRSAVLVSAQSRDLPQYIMVMLVRVVTMCLVLVSNDGTLCIAFGAVLFAAMAASTVPGNGRRVASNCSRFAIFGTSGRVLTRCTPLGRVRSSSRSSGGSDGRSSLFSF